MYSYPVEDLAVIRVQDPGGLVPARFGDMRELRVGEIVLAMGSPLGLEGSVTQGIVSALGRAVTEPPEPQAGLPGTTLRQAIQTSAPINPGNGGALVNLDAEVVGVPTLAAVSPVGDAAPGLGFAIPADIVRDLATADRRERSGGSLRAGVDGAHGRHRDGRTRCTGRRRGGRRRIRPARTRRTATPASRTARAAGAAPRE